MATISSSKFNLSRSQNAVLTIEGEKIISYFLQNFNLPGMSIGVAPVANPFKVHKEPGSTLTYEDLEVDLIVGNMPAKLE